jgi:hypothetical protein
MSVVKWSGAESGSTIGSSLDLRGNSLVIFKKLDDTGNWQTNININGTQYRMELNNTHGDYGDYTSTFTENTFSIPNHTEWGSTGNSMIGYCFKDEKLKCKIGEYNGNGTSTNNILFDFDAQWVMIKRVDAAYNWQIQNIKSGNLKQIEASESSIERNNTDYGWTFIEKGINVGAGGVQDWEGINADGGKYIYLAIGKEVDNTPTEIETTFKLDAREGRFNKHKVQMDYKDAEVLKVQIDLDKKGE